MNSLKVTLRQLWGSPGFSTIAILTLALGLGTCLTTFGLVHAVLVKPLPYADPARLVWIQNWQNGTFSDQASRMDNYLDWKTHTESFADIGGFSPFYDMEKCILNSVTPPERLLAVQVTYNLLDILGVELALGRSFSPEECHPNANKVTIVSHAFWQRHLGGRETAVGSPITINGSPVEVVGILRQDAFLDLVVSPGQSPDVLLPLAESGKILNWGNTVIGVGRLKQGTTLNQAQQEMTAYATRQSESDAERAGYSPETGATLIPLDRQIRGGFRNGFSLLTGAVLFVWLIACINLSSLLLARADRRQLEFSLRSALGATRWDLVKSALSESLILASAGCLLGTLAASYGITLLTRLNVYDVPLLQTAKINPPLLVAAVSLGLISAAICSVFPALRLWEFSGPNLRLRSETRTTSGRSSARFRHSLVVAELALAVVLLVGAGLLVRSFSNVLKLDIGFDPNRMYAWQVDTDREFESLEARNQYYEELRERIARIDGIEAVALSDTVPLGFKRHWPIDGKGITYQDGDYRGGYARFIDSQCLHTMKIPVVRGRNFTAQDQLGSEPVILVSQTLADRAWKGEDPLGKIARVNDGMEFRVIGIVGDVAHGLNGDEQSDAYFLLNQWKRPFWISPFLILRSTESRPTRLADIRTTIQGFDADLPTNGFTQLTHTLDRAIAPRRFIMGVLVSFAASALLLTTIGLHGLIAYNVGLRLKEFGVRFAVGAQRNDVFLMVLRNVLRILIVGSAIGFFGALLVTQLLQSQLFGITSVDPLSYLVALIFLTTIAVLAAWLPARRAANLNLSEVLRAT